MSATLPTSVSIVSPNPYYPNFWNNNFSATETTDDTGARTITVNCPSANPSIPDAKYLIQVYTAPIAIKPWFIDYGNTKKADTTVGFHNVISDSDTEESYSTPDNTCPGNTIPGVYWTNYLINGKQHVAPQLKKTNEFHSWHPTTTFDYDSSNVLTNHTEIAVLHLDSFYQKGDHFSQSFLTANSDCENFVIGANNNSEMYREHLLLMQYDFSIDVSSISLPYTTFVMHNSYYGGNITFLNSQLGSTDNSLPMLNNNACDLNYGNIVNQITIDEDGHPTVTPTTFVFVDTKAILASVNLLHYKFKDSHLYPVKPQMDHSGTPIYGNLPYNNPTDGPLDANGNVVDCSGFLVDVSTLPPPPAFPQPQPHPHHVSH